MPTQPCRAAALAALLAAGSATIALAQDPAVDPHHPEAGAPDATPPAGPAPGSPGQPDQPGMMGEGMMGGDMMAGVMGEGMMGGGMMQPHSTGPGGPMHGHAMRILFAIADADGDRELSFEEVTAVHRRIFDAVDADRDGEVTRGEVEAFMRE